LGGRRFLLCRKGEKKKFVTVGGRKKALLKGGTSALEKKRMSDGTTNFDGEKNRFNRRRGGGGPPLPERLAVRSREGGKKGCRGKPWSQTTQVLEIYLENREEKFYRRRTFTKKRTVCALGGEACCFEGGKACPSFCFGGERDRQSGGGKNPGLEGALWNGGRGKKRGSYKSQREKGRVC